MAISYSHLLDTYRFGLWIKAPDSPQPVYILWKTK